MSLYNPVHIFLLRLSIFFFYLHVHQARRTGLAALKGKEPNKCSFFFFFCSDGRKEEILFNHVLCFVLLFFVHGVGTGLD